MKILINGPAGGGKSVIVRQVMSLYDCVAAVPGGIGGLPRAYRCERMSISGIVLAKLEILGNYENTFRDHHGLAEFNRYRADFVAALDYAIKISHPVLCEGGFLHPRRLDCDAAAKFCADCTILWLDPPEARESAIFRRGRDLGDDSYRHHVDAAAATGAKMLAMGAKCEEISSRADCLRRVCELIDPTLDPTLAAAHAQNYR